MTSPLNDAARAERQARIEDDIRRLFARYRSADRSGAQTPASTRYTPVRRSRFRREAADERLTRAGGG
jgi:hypothetical protein